MSKSENLGHLERGKFTPKEAAYSIAIDALLAALYPFRSELDYERSGYAGRVRVQIRKLLQRLGHQSTLDFMIPTADDTRASTE
jgi:hypothetical protein